MKIKFENEDGAKFFTQGRYRFHVYPYDRKWTISLYVYGIRELGNCHEIGFHFREKLSEVPLTINEVREHINNFLTK
jgi:hypothetical protein